MASDEKTITANINDLHDFIATPAGASAGRILQEQASEAIRMGLGSDAWRTFMTNFASNEAQLQRLMGEDDFVEKPWGMIALAYIPANAMCGGATTGFTLRNIPKPFIKALNEGLSTESGNLEGDKLLDNADHSKFI